MSIIAYAQLTNKRDEAAPGTSSTTSNPGMKPYIDALAALVPAEVLSLHAIIVSATTKTTYAGAENSPIAGATTTIPIEAVSTLSYSFWGLVTLSLALYAVPRYVGGRWDRYDWIRVLIAPMAFVGWTMLQRATAFDAAFPQVPDIPRTVTALFIAVILAGTTTILATLADRKP